MSDLVPEGSSNVIVERAKAIILKPREEWPVIERETMSSGDIFTRYAIPLAAIGPVAQFIGGQIFGYGAMGFTYRPSFVGSLSMAIGSFILSLVGLFVVSFIANKLAPNFGGESSSRNAFKLVAYSMTASWLAGIFGLVPSLSFLAIVGLYSFYLFYLGTGPLMKVPAEKATTYTIVTVIAVILLYICIGALTATIGRSFGVGPFHGGTVTTSEGGTIDMPGTISIDAKKIEEAARGIEDMASGKRQAAAAGDLQALLPASIGSYQRTSIESSKTGPASQAEARYEADGKSFRLKVADIAIAGAMAGVAGAFGVEANKEDADSYERTTTKDGNLVVEKWNRASGSGSFMTMVGKRFMIEAEGEAGSIDELKAAVASVDAGRLAALSKQS